jgi:hypothetical protein
MKRYRLRMVALFGCFICLVGIPIASVGQTTDPPPLPESAIYSVKKKKPDQDSQPPPAAEAPPVPLTSEAQKKSAPAARQTSTQSQPPPEQSLGEAPFENSRPKQTSSQGIRQPAASGKPLGVITEHVLTRKFGSEAFQQLLGQVKSQESKEGREGQGSSTADQWFDRARPRTGNDSNVHPSGTEFFKGSSSAVTNGTFKPATVQDAKETTATYGSIPGGIVLEGVAVGLGDIHSVRYDRRFNAFILNDRAAYFIKIPPKSVAVLCRAIDQDEKERVGVSLGQKELVYGEVPKDSDLAWDLKIADHFLGDIVFARNDWTAGYRFAGGFKPEPPAEVSYHVAVFFNLNGFRFQMRQEEIELAQANFDVRILPLSESTSADGGHLPDESAISEGRSPGQFELNARHVAENISYYRRERIIDRIFAYGEVAAFIRELKHAGFDLEDLASHIPGDS